MSVLARRIIEIKLAENPSFKLWDNSKLMKYLEEQIDIFNGLSNNGTGQLELPIKILKEMIDISETLDIDKVTIKRLQEDIDFAISNNNDYVIYDCY
jgi:hypothetical protein